jgi:hypothetical protein
MAVNRRPAAKNKWPARWGIALASGLATAGFFLAVLNGPAPAITTAAANPDPTLASANTSPSASAYGSSSSASTYTAPAYQVTPQFVTRGS